MSLWFGKWWGLQFIYLFSIVWQLTKLLTFSFFKVTQCCSTFCYKILAGSVIVIDEAIMSIIWGIVIILWHHYKNLALYITVFKHIYVCINIYIYIYIFIYKDKYFASQKRAKKVSKFQINQYDLGAFIWMTNFKILMDSHRENFKKIHLFPMYKIYCWT